MEIGKVSKDTIQMSILQWLNWRLDGKEPALLPNFYKGDKCDVDYEILGLWPIGKSFVLNWTVVITIIVVSMLIVLILFIAVWIYAQKHRSQKRARLQSSLMNNAEGGETTV